LGGMVFYVGLLVVVFVFDVVLIGGVGWLFGEWFDFV